jgi:hypothetical protein
VTNTPDKNPKKIKPSRASKQVPSAAKALRERPNRHGVQFEAPATPAWTSPAELLSPAAILQRFTERTQELLQAIPEEERPNPSAVTAALRQGVLDAFRTREDFVAKLVELEADAHRMESGNLPARQWRIAVRNALLVQGIHVDGLADDPNLFVVVEGEGESFEVIRPAYVDQTTGKLILSGQLRRVPAKTCTDSRDIDTTGGEQR